MDHVRGALHGLVRAWLLVTAAALLACQSTYYDEYRRVHPGFEATLPRLDASLEEVLAALYAPSPLERIDVVVEQLAIYRTGPEEWVEIDFERVRSGDFVSVSDADYAVLVTWRCSFEQGLNTGGSDRSAYYLLPGNRLTAYDHYRFREKCSAANEFLAARGALIPTELAVFERVAAGRRVSLDQAYRRGLAYIEAGRLQEARAMLVVGERGYRAAAARLRAAGRESELAETSRLRQALMRSLGVEPR